jgi:membrane associated rhomboid family serine protease
VPWVTWSLICLNVIVFAATWSLPEHPQERLYYLYGLVPARYTYPDWAAWAGLRSSDLSPFFTSMFLHGSWLHIVLNMWLLWIFGDNVEDRMGALRYTAFYLLCGLVAGLLQVYSGPGSTIPAIGASGAIAGIMGAYFFMYPNARVVIWVFFLPLFIQVPAVAFVGLWVIFQLYKATSGLVDGQSYAEVAWWGHLGGFIAGMLTHRLFLWQGRDDAAAGP